MVDQVVDSNVWIASFLENDQWHQRATEFMSEFEARQHVCHLPSVVLIETCGAIAHQTQGNPIREVARVRRSFLRWEQAGLVHLYQLDQDRVSKALDTSARLRLKGADAVIVSLAQELGDLPLKTFDREIQGRYPNAAP